MNRKLIFSLTFFCIIFLSGYAYAEDIQVPVPGKVTLVDLGSKSCIPCKMMFPVLENLKKYYEGTAEVIFIDVRENPEAAERFGIKTIPTQIYYDKNGNEYTRHVGYIDEERIKKKMDALINK